MVHTSKIKKGSDTARNCVFINILLGCLKLVGWFFSGSIALLADSIHSFSDLISSSAAYIGLKIAQRKPTEKFPYGYYKAESFALLIISLVIIVTGIGIFKGSFEKLFNPTKISLPLIALSVAFISAIISYILSRYEGKFGEKINSEALISDAKESKMDTYTTISVFVGIVFSYFGFPLVEPLVGIGISLFVIKTGLSFIKGAVYGLMDVCPKPELVSEIRKIAKGIDGVKNVDSVRIRKSGPFLIGDVEVETEGKLPIKTVEKILNELRRVIKKKIREFDVITITPKPQEYKEIIGYEHGIEYVKKFIERLRKKKKTPLIIGIAGASASGKTYFGEKLSRELNATFINFDMFYKKNTREIAKKFGENFDHPQLMDFNYMKDVLDKIKSGKKKIRIPIYSFKEGKRIGYETKYVKNIVVVEGLYTFYKDLKKYMDLKIVMESRMHDLLLRRISRDVKRSGEDMQAILQRVLKTVFPMYFLYIEPTFKGADIKIISTYNPLVDEKTGRKIIQIKTKFSPRFKKFLKGCKKIKKVTQVDTYFIKPFESYIDLKEFMRFREERDSTPKYFMTFKLRNPAGNLTSVRELEISHLYVDIVSHILSLGYRIGKIIKKERTIYQKGNVQVMYDRVFIKRKKNYFIEFRSSSESDIQKLINELKIPKSKLINKPYVQIVLEEESIL